MTARSILSGNPHILAVGLNRAHRVLVSFSVYVETPVHPIGHASFAFGSRIDHVAQADDRIDRAAVEPRGSDCNCPRIAVRAMTRPDRASEFVQLPPPTVIESPRAREGVLPVEYWRAGLEKSPIYAPPSVGQPSEQSPSPPAEQISQIATARFDWITNTGTLLDILA